MHNHIERLISNSSEYAPPDAPPDDISINAEVKSSSRERQGTSVEPHLP